MSEIIIRPATGADQGSLRAAAGAVREHEGKLGGAAPPGADAYLDQMHRQMETSGTILVAEQAGAFAGFVSFWIASGDAETPGPDRCGYVSDIYVVPEFRGRGIAQKLLAEAERRLAAEGIARLRMAVLAANGEARRLYEKTGAIPCEIVYEKPLAKPLPKEIGGAKGPEPTRYGDWEHKGRCTDF